jgi:ubiquitin-like protein Pup
MAMATKQYRPPKEEKYEPLVEMPDKPQDQEALNDIDELLDEIDEILEENAEEFLARYVQKGGE